MEGKMWKNNILQVFIILATFLTFAFCIQKPTCVLNTGDCVYEFSLQEKPQCFHEKINSNPFDSHMRYKRSSVITKIDNQESLENQKLRRKISKLEKRLTESMDSLSSRVLRGVRRMEQKVNNLLAPHQKRNVQFHNGALECPQGFIKVDNWPSCYPMSKFNTTWYEARDFCTALESDLVALGTVREHYLLTFLIKNNPELKNAIGWWTSGTFVAKTRQWMWTAQLFMKPFTFIKWATNEPNEEASQCVYLNRDDDHLWHDDICTNRYNFICEAMARTV